MHIAFDEDTHLFCALLRKGSVPLETCTHRSLFVQAVTLRPQEPRRPRFSFFILHNVKEQTSHPEGTNVSNLQSGRNESAFRLNRQIFRPVRFRANQWEQQSRSRRQRRRYLGDQTIPVNTVFRFSFRLTKSWNRKEFRSHSKVSLIRLFSDLPQFAAPFGASLCSGERGSSGGTRSCQHPQTGRHDIFVVIVRGRCGYLGRRPQISRSLRHQYRPVTGW